MSLTSRLRALLEYANNKTEKNDPNLGEAIKTLVEGYGQGSDSKRKWDFTNMNVYLKIGESDWIPITKHPINWEKIIDNTNNLTITKNQKYQMYSGNTSSDTQARNGRYLFRFWEFFKIFNFYGNTNAAFPTNFTMFLNIGDTLTNGEFVDSTQWLSNAIGANAVPNTEIIDNGIIISNTIKLSTAETKDIIYRYVGLNITGSSGSSNCLSSGYFDLGNNSFSSLGGFEKEINIKFIW